jgi:hypothetical protein
MSMTEDPGFVPRAGSRVQQKGVIDELLSSWNYDDEHFCVICMTRQPLRSKHCKRCKRCVAKHDHHCPWIHNCVGANNMRHFVLYVVAMEIGIILFVNLVILYLEAAPAAGTNQCNIFAESICGILNKDTFTVILTIWAALQLTWVTMLLFVQLVQISRATTTWESMRGNHHQSSRVGEAMTGAFTAGTTTMNGAQLGPQGHGPDPAISDAHGHGHRHGRGWFDQWKKILGLDTFVATASSGLEVRRGNPFSRGVVTNCKDFWCDPAPYFGQREVGAAMLGGDVVNYTRMYETPSRMKLRSRRDDGGVYHSVEGDDVV